MVMKPHASLPAPIAGAAAVVIALALAACPGPGAPGGAATAPPAPAAPSNHGGDPDSHTLLASLSRGACYGWCPVYEVRVYADGSVEYHGDDFVKVQGDATATLAPDQRKAIEELFMGHGYFDLADAYTDVDWTDAPSSTTSFHLDGRDKTIRHYHGDQDAPAALSEIEDGLDQIVGIERWIGTEQERRDHKGRW